MIKKSKIMYALAIWFDLCWADWSLFEYNRVWDEGRIVGRSGAAGYSGWDCLRSRVLSAPEMGLVDISGCASALHCDELYLVAR